MMERSSRFMSLSGLAGILAGIYALAGAVIAYKLFYFNPDRVSYTYTTPGNLYTDLLKVVFLGALILVLAIGTAIFLCRERAIKRGENAWTSITRQLLLNMAVPLVTGGLFILILIAKGMIGLMAPCTLLFYGLALYSASKFTYEEMGTLGLVQVALGLISSWFVEYGLLLWALGFGVAHIIYGIYMHYRYER